MFSGLACFSPTVERETRELWKRYGGRIASSINELEGVQWFFAALGDCDWIRRLTEHGVTVHEQSWIVDSLKSGFTSLPSLYALHCGPLLGPNGSWLNVIRARRIYLSSGTRLGRAPSRSKGLPYSSTA
ncbi:hypothetical protein FRC15_003138 [Serendipita sp. 397]|nr:hypothetical protein FRC15_003138 [Serendipita sp. 397]